MVLLHIRNGMECMLAIPSLDFCVKICFTNYFVFSIVCGVVYYHLLLRRETRIPRVAPYYFRIGIWILLCIGDRNPIHPQPLGSCGPLQEKDA